MGDPAKIADSDFARTTMDQAFKGSIWDKRIDQRAVERFRSPAQRLELELRPFASDFSSVSTLCGRIESCFPN